MVAASLLTFEPAGPAEPQAARLIATPAAEIAMAAERNFRMFISLPFILRAQRWVPVTCNAGMHFGFEADACINSVLGRTGNVRNFSKSLRPVKQI
jgi:hypothetical protein